MGKLYLFNPEKIFYKFKKGTYTERLFLKFVYAVR